MKVDKRLAKLIAQECYQKMGEDIQLLDVRKKCDYCNHVLIVSGKNRMHLDALRDHIGEFLKEKEVDLYGSDGKPDSGWIIMDLGSVIIHLFHPEVREFYDLPGIWNNPKQIELDLPDEEND